MSSILSPFISPALETVLPLRSNSSIPSIRNPFSPSKEDRSIDEDENSLSPNTTYVAPAPKYIFSEEVPCSWILSAL